MEMTQTAPFPVLLAELVTQLEYKPKWKFTLEQLDRRSGQ